MTTLPCQPGAAGPDELKSPLAPLLRERLDAAARELMLEARVKDLEGEIHRLTAERDMLLAKLNEAGMFLAVAGKLK